MSHINKKTALITGASTGIGYELAKLFAADSYDLVLIARGEGGLKKVAEELMADHSITITTIAQDLSVPGAAQAISNLTHHKGITIDVLVNNAGFATYGQFTSVNLSEQLGMMQVNMNALVELTHEYLPEMRQRKSGKILNVASTAAFQPGPYMAIYFATKAFVLSFSEALSVEVSSDLVTITVLCPGPTHTEFAKRARLEFSTLFKGNVMNAAMVARSGYVAMNKGKTVIITGIANKLGAFIVRLFSRNAVLWILQRTQSPKP
jgi:short-subunit dehydrogenase